MYYLTFSAPTANLLGMPDRITESYKMYSRPSSYEIDRLKRKFAIEHNNELDEIKCVLTKDR